MRAYMSCIALTLALVLLRIHIAVLHRAQAVEQDCYCVGGWCARTQGANSGHYDILVVIF